MSQQNQPDKHQPHAFEPVPEVPIVMPRTGIMMQQGLPGQGTGLPNYKSSNCALCGGASHDKIHTDAEHASDVEPLRWG